MIKMVIKKNRSNGILEGIDAENEVRYGFKCLISQIEKNDIKSEIIKIDLTFTNAKHREDMNFKLSNKVFNNLNKIYWYEKLNYLFVVEYPEIVSKGNYMIDNLDHVRVHTHIIIETSIPFYILEKKIVDVFGKQCDIYSENITKRNDKENYINYLVKQNKYLNSKSYNFKIDV